MAIAIASYNSANVNGNSLTITKPTGLSAGDLLVCMLSGDTNTGVINTPSGWTAVTSNSSTYLMTKSVYKVADSTDAAAANFTFTRTQNSYLLGTLMRITGFDSGSIIGTSNSNIGGSGGSSFSITTVTPSKANSLLIIGASNVTATDPSTITGYSIATSNPTWTEISDNKTSSQVFGVAYATRPETTATGDITVSFSSSGDYARGAMILVINPLGTTYTLAMGQGSCTLTGQTLLLKRIIEMLIVSGSYSSTGFSLTLKKVYTMLMSVGNYLLTGVNIILNKRGWSNISKNTSTFTKQSKNTTTWTDQSKNSSTWTNQNKS